MKKPIKNFFIIAIIITLILIIFFGIIKNGKKNSTEDTGKLQVEEYEVKLGKIFDSISETGQLEPLQQVEVMTAIGGKLLEFKVKEGDSVTKGQILGYLEPDITEIQRITSIKSNFENSKIELEIIEKDYTQKRQLYEKGIISENEFLESQKRLTNVRNSYISAEQQLKSINDLGIKDNIDKVNKVEITSPATGVIISMDIEVGETIRAGTSAYAQGTIICIIADLSSMKVAAQINEVDIGKIYVGQDVLISLDAFPRERFSGKIGFISPVARDVGNLKKFDILIDVLSKDPKLKPGMTANLDLIMVDKKGVLVIPFNAIEMKEGKFFVLKKKDLKQPLPEEITIEELPSYVEETEVKLGVRGKMVVEVEEGIKESDILILKNQLKGDEHWRMNRTSSRRRR